MKQPQFTVYVLYSLKDLQFYIGFTTDFNRRMCEHKEGRSKSTASRRPFKVVLVEYYYSKKGRNEKRTLFQNDCWQENIKINAQ
ncbi:MAG: GIY-YIG nuclease family protein [Bacteroidetes bacterium]|nr:GIY-YIG nuclease family protein [Bacteroidota bacterium]